MFFRSGLLKKDSERESGKHQSFRVIAVITESAIAKVPTVNNERIRIIVGREQRMLYAPACARAKFHASKSRELVPSSNNVLRFRAACRAVFTIVSGKIESRKPLVLVMESSGIDRKETKKLTGHT